MIIVCDCGARLKISDDKLTDAGVKIKCPKCGTAHLAARPRQAAGAAASFPPVPGTPSLTEPAMPWFAPASAAVPGLPTQGPLVLVAHDSKVVAEMIDGVLKNSGMSTKHAANGLEALKMATDLKPQAMVVDVGLTGIYGFELCERLKGDPDTKGIKIILLSSVYGLTAYKRSPENLYGADDYIEKHHIPDRLVPKLQRLIGGKEDVSAANESVGDHATSSAPIEARGERVVEPPTAPSTVPRVEQTSPPLETKGLQIPEIPSILPKTPVTLVSSRKRSASVTSSARSADPPSAPAEEERKDQIVRPAPVEMRREEPNVVAAPVAAPVPPEPVKEERSPAPIRREEPQLSDASVRLDASFFEHEEYEAPATAAAQGSADPAEIEKAKRFARIIVSDIVLYNQETVTEGVREGTFYDLLKDDITEGRAVYAERVPESIRRGRDYLQEAFDDFIASKKKHR
jgi:predicted Zn finger-like uncharacterized protein